MSEDREERLLERDPCLDAPLDWTAEGDPEARHGLTAVILAAPVVLVILGLAMIGRFVAWFGGREQD